MDHINTLWESIDRTGLRENPLHGKYVFMDESASIYDVSAPQFHTWISIEMT